MLAPRPGPGGSSSINGVLFVCGNHQGYDGWRQLGLEGWAHIDVLTFFSAIRRESNQVYEYHQANGPLKTGPSASLATLDQCFLHAGQAAGYEFNPDFNRRSQLSVGKFDMSVLGKHRWSVNRGYPRPAGERFHLDVQTGAHVHRILFDEVRASCIE